MGIRRTSRFRFHFLSRLLSSFTVTNCRPTEIDSDLRDVLSNSRRPVALLRRRNHRRSHDHGFALNKRTWCLDIHVDAEVAFQAKSLHRLPAFRAPLPPVWALVYHGRGV